jgi:hypothetical protein
MGGPQEQGGGARLRWGRAPGAAPKGDPLAASSATAAAAAPGGAAPCSSMSTWHVCTAACTASP